MTWEGNNFSKPNHRVSAITVSYFGVSLIFTKG